VQCRLNALLVDTAADIPVFIEFEGVLIEKRVFKNAKAPVNFGLFKPNKSGSLLCVIEFAGAEFASEPLLLAPD
jgi:hypothetical protein